MKCGKESVKFRNRCWSIKDILGKPRIRMKFKNKKALMNSKSVNSLPFNFEKNLSKQDREKFEKARSRKKFYQDIQLRFVGIYWLLIVLSINLFIPGFFIALIWIKPSKLWWIFYGLLILYKLVFSWIFIIIPFTTDFGTGRRRYLSYVMPFFSIFHLFTCFTPYIATKGNLILKLCLSFINILQVFLFWFQFYKVF